MLRDEQTPTYLRPCDPKMCETYVKDTPVVVDSLNDHCYGNKISFGTDELIIAFQDTDEV